MRNQCKLYNYNSITSPQPFFFSGGGLILLFLVYNTPQPPTHRAYWNKGFQQRKQTFSRVSLFTYTHSWLPTDRVSLCGRGPVERRESTGTTPVSSDCRQRHPAATVKVIAWLHATNGPQCVLVGGFDYFNRCDQYTNKERVVVVCGGGGLL